MKWFRKVVAEWGEIEKAWGILGYFLGDGHDLYLNNMGDKESFFCICVCLCVCIHICIYEYISIIHLMCTFGCMQILPLEGNINKEKAANVPILVWSLK